MNIYLTIGVIYFLFSLKKLETYLAEQGASHLLFIGYVVCMVIIPILWPIFAFGKMCDIIYDIFFK